MSKELIHAKEVSVEDRELDVGRVPLRGDGPDNKEMLQCAPTHDISVAEE